VTANSGSPPVETVSKSDAAALTPQFDATSPEPPQRDERDYPADSGPDAALRYQHSQDGRDAVVAASLSANALAERAAAAESQPDPTCADMANPDAYRAYRSKA
jgi:hypothetical protein